MLGLVVVELMEVNRDTVILSSEGWVGNTFKMETPKIVPYMIWDIGCHHWKITVPSISHFLNIQIWFSQLTTSFSTLSLACSFYLYMWYLMNTVWKYDILISYYSFNKVHVFCLYYKQCRIILENLKKRDSKEENKFKNCAEVPFICCFMFPISPFALFLPYPLSTPILSFLLSFLFFLSFFYFYIVALKLHITFI